MSHDHEHAHGHSHAPANFNQAFAIGTALNLAFVIVEAVYGVNSHSLALLADAGHNLSDVFALLLAWGASALSDSVPTKRHTYGWRSTSILAALFNAILLLIAVGAIGWEAIGRFRQPSSVAGTTVMWVALIGIFINGATAFLFASGRKGDLNVRGAFLHMAADAVVSLGVVVAGFLIVKTGLHWIDPVTSLVIVAVIAVGTWGLLRDSVNFALHAVPPGVNLPEVNAYLAGLPGVTEVHDLHIWGMSTTETALTAHLVRADPAGDDALLTSAAHDLRERFKIAHATLQLETSARLCELAPADRV
jgi:cobalt-zinc-cadmium efflux system protein